MKDAEIFEIAGGQVRAWIEQGDTVHLKAVDRYGDPVELAPEELKALIKKLSRLYENFTVEDA